VAVDPNVVGAGDLHVDNKWQGRIGYGVHVDLWGRGIGESIARRIIAFGFGEIGLHRIVGTCDPRNVASARILTKVGMTYEGRMRETSFIRDGWRDSDLYSLLESEWKA